ncbi:MAG: CARDB domain-containing protein, partial [Halothiobacillaceae bacterium]|nr:CARDB domain-containing protein [Halothiobacillaceae bacterium]
MKRIKTKLGMLVVLLATLMPGQFALADGSGAMSPFPITGAFSATQRADQDHVSIIEFGGNYDKTFANGGANVEPRAVIAREFYRTHPDNYDFLVVFSSFEFDTGEATAFHWGVQNKVQGIGLPQFDNSALFGSKGKLQGYIDMAALTRYQTEPTNPDFEWPLGVLAHEMLHQWGSFVKFKQADGTLSNALLGRQDAHWSYLLDSSASVEYGAKWRDNGNGTYTSVGTRTFFSPLDLYLMGFYKASEVPNFTLIDNPQVDKTQLPQENVTVSGTPRTISINDIIAAEGPRVPDATTSQKEFRLGFIFLVGPNQQVTDAQILALNNIRNAYMTRFAILTGGRAVAQVYPEAMPIETPGDPGIVNGGGGVRTTPANIDEGLAWLRAQQNAQGFWSDKEATTQRDTMVATSTLRQIDSSFIGGVAALNWLAQHPSPNNDYLARQASLLAEDGKGGGAAQRSALLGLQNADGGWGLAAGYQSNVLDSALAVLALAGQGVNQAVLDKAGQYLVAAQNSDGGWSFAPNGPSRTSVTATAIRALKALDLHAAVMPKTISFLRIKQNPDGGFGDSPSTVHDTANVMQAAISVDAIDQINADAAAAYLLANQSVDGSWGGSVYATASAVSVIKRFNYPNWAIKSLSAIPDVASDGDKVRLDIVIKNDANLVTPAGVLRVYDGDVASGGKPIGPDIAVPVMGPGASLSFTTYFDTLDLPGAHTLVAMVDPDNLQTEMSKADNSASVAVKVQAAPAGIDLALAAPDITVIPVKPNRLPSTLGLSATVRNVGLTDAFAVPVVLLAGPAGNQVVVASTVVDVLNRSNVVVNFNYLLTTAGTVDFTVQVDPDNSIAETNKVNNTATASVSTFPNVDLAVNNVDISIDKNPVLVGDDVNFKVVLHNSGTVDSPSTEVRYTITDGNTTKTIRTNTVQIGAGKTLEQQIVWRVDMTGSIRFSAQLDPSALVPEEDKTNNTGSLTLSSGVVSGPNLVTSYQEFTFNPATALEGGNVALSVVVHNTGSVAATNVPVVFYLGDPSLNDVLATETIASLAPNSSTTVTTTWAGLPTPGDKLIFAVVDPDNLIVEFSETDNSAFNVLTVLSLPDLAISSGDVRFSPPFPRAGETLTITAQVANLGEQAATNVVVRAFDGNPASGGTQIGTDQTIANIAGHGSSVVSFSLNLTAISNTRPIVIQVDPANLILERNKSNNTAQHDLAVQDGNLYVSNLYFSPNGDGIKDTTELFFRLANTATVKADVINKRGVVVRSFSGDALANVSTGSLVWDGLDDAGRLVQDGPYKLRLADVNGPVVGEVNVTLDTNRSSLLDAANTKYGSFSNLTCELPNVDLHFTDDDSRAFFGITNGNSPQVPYPRGIYSMDGNGGDIRAIVPESFFPQTSFYPLFGSVAGNGSKVTFVTTNYFNYSQDKLWIVDGDGSNPYALSVFQDAHYSAQAGLLQLSSDGKMSYAFRYPGDIVGVSTEPTAVEKIIWTNPNGYVSPWDSYFSKDRNKFFAASGCCSWGHDVIDLKSGQSASIPHARSYSWSPDGKYIVTGIDTGWDSANTSINIYDMNGGLVKAIPSPIQSPVDWIDVVTGEPVWNSNSTEFAISVAVSNQSNCDAPPAGTDFGGIYTVDVATGVTHKVAGFNNLPSGECGWSYHISTWDGGQWVERDVLHYGLFMQKQSANLSKYLPDANGQYRVRIRQTGHETAHVDDVALLINQQRVVPRSAVHLGTSEDALAKVIAADNEILHLHEATMEVQWDKAPAGGQIELLLGAREESISTRKDLLPFSYPPTAGLVYNYVVTGQRPLVVDGNQTGQDNLGEPLFNAYSRPGTGHPSANVYGYVQSDDQYLYAALDFTVDNDEDGASDWATIRIRKAGVWKDYRVTKADKTNGRVGFIRTGKVNYHHKYYEFKIALADIGASAGDILDIAFQGYGSAAINTTPQSTDLSAEGTLYWVPGERSLIYNSYDQNYGSQYLAFKLDEQNSRTVLFADWMDNYSNQVQNLSFSPTGRQILFDSGRDVNDPSSRCYQQGWQDTWSFHSLLNLTADLRAIRSSKGGVRLEGSAADQNFSSYSLDYANADTPDQWHPVLPAADVAVIDEIFTTWVPPAAGTYLVRLTVQDLAGNSRQNIKRVSWSDTPSITDLYRSPRILSPNGDGVQDEATIHYRVLEPVHLEFNFYNQENGDRVRTIVRDHSAAGVETNAIWDGRDDNGLPVVDGIYLMRVQNYEFSFTVDTTVPLVNLEVNNAYQPLYVTTTSDSGLKLEKAYVSVAPSLRWDITDANYLSSVVETGDGNNPEFWNEFYNPDPAETGTGESYQLSLTLDQFVNKTFRLSAKDSAGNVGVASVGGGISTVTGGEELIVAGVGDFAVNPTLKNNYLALLAKGTPPSASEFMALVNSSGGLFELIGNVLYVPMDQQDGGTELSGILNSPRARFAVTETVGSPLMQMFVQFRKPTTALWTEQPMSGYAVTDVSEPVLLTTTAIPEQTLNAIWDMAGIEPGQTYVVRLRAIDAAGIEHFSNSLQVGSGDSFAFHGLILESDSKTKDIWKKIIAPLLSTPLSEGEYVLWGEQSSSQPRTEVQLYINSKEDPRFATDRVAAKVTAPGGTFIFRTKELQVCTNYTGYVVLLGEPDASGARQEIGRTASLPFTVPCLRLKTDVQVQHAADCNGPSPNQVKIRFATSSLALEAPLKLLTLSRQDPVVGKDIVFNVNKPKSVKIPNVESEIPYPYEFSLDTSTLPEGTLQFQAELTNVIDEVVTQPVTVMVDHTPPTIAITYPVEAQSVCGVPVDGQDGKTRNVVTIEGNMLDANGLHYEMDSSTSGEADLALFHQSRSVSSYNSIAAANGEPPTSAGDRPQFHLPGTVYGPLAAVFDQTDTITARLRVFDKGGFQQCVVRSFQFDGSVVGTSLSLDRALFSPNGDGVADSLLITYAVDESSKVDIDVFQASGPDTNGQMHIIGDSLQSLAKQASTLSGMTSVEWDGLAGGSVVQDGKYAIQIIFTDSCGNVDKLVRYVEVDNTPPAISVNYPASSTLSLPLIVEIQGSIYDLHMQGYTIDFGVGTTPDTWVQVKSGSGKVSNAVLAAWNTYGLQGAHTLRVIGTDAAGNQSTTLIPVNIQTPLNIISAFEVMPSPFSPNDDGRRESAAIRVSLDQDAVVTMVVKDAQNAIRRTLVSAQILNIGASNFSWDGKDDSGQVVPDGIYTISLLATLSTDVFVKQDEKITVVVDSTAPLVDITRPNGFATGTGGVMGSITDPNLTHYTVSITDSPTAPNWNQIDTGTLARNNAVLASLAGLVEGDYALRIEAQDEAENMVDRVIPFTVDNTPPKVDLTAPLDGSFVGVKKLPVNIIGSIDEKNLKSYTLEFGAGATPTAWTTLATGSALPLPSILKAWDVSTLPD